MEVSYALQDLVNKIHESSTKAYIVCSGGGSEVFPLLLSGGGGSKTLLAGLIPYSQDHLKEFICNVPDKVVSEETAYRMARRAYEKAADENDEAVVGIGLTASLRKVPDEREGRVHEVWAVLESSFKQIRMHFVFDQNCFFLKNKERPDAVRNIEETACASIILKLLAEFSDVSSANVIELASIGVTEKYEITDFPVTMRIWNNGFRKSATIPAPRLLFPGSFNPPHEGHLEMVKMASELIQQPCLLEISVRNVDKAELSKQQIAERLNTIHKTALFNDKDCCFGVTDVILTNAPTFVEKSKLFPGSTFVIGFDTATRIVDPKYAGSIDDVLQCFEDNKIKFILFPRIISGVLKDDLSVLPERFKNLITLVKLPRKHAHLASRDLRK